MLLVGIAVLFLVIGVWEHGGKLAALLFAGFLVLGILEIRRGAEAPVSPLISVRLSALADLWP
ncbi:MAG: hypothetical protein GC160_12460 [Acidobacteria bacterium]|nr:hypothetical protein [Acidobacteriota bacterium]